MIAAVYADGSAPERSQDRFRKRLTGLQTYGFHYGAIQGRAFCSERPNRFVGASFAVCPQRREEMKGFILARKGSLRDKIALLYIPNGFHAH
jgi:hypothetical protein